jgi:acetylglutamate kinase
MSKIDLDTYHSLKSDNAISNGMIPKLENCYQALVKGVEQVFITDGKTLNVKAGTKVCL